MKVKTFEGTPEEFKAVAYLFGETIAPEEPTTNGKEGTRTVEPQKAIRVMLKRRPIPEGQKAVYRALANGEVSYAEFLKRTGRTGAQMAGVMGALGGRINHTKEIHQAGLPGSVGAVIIYRREDEGFYLSLTPDAEQVLKEEKII